jgi:hypothetical protein
MALGLTRPAKVTAIVCDKGEGGKSLKFVGGETRFLLLM